MELVPNIILEEEEDSFLNGLTGMINGIIHSALLWKKIKQGGPTPLMLTIMFLTSLRSNKLGNQRQELSVKCLNQVTNRIFNIGKRQS